jgi:hypothetical protein
MDGLYDAPVVTTTHRAHQQDRGEEMNNQTAPDESVFEIVIFHLKSGATHEALLETSGSVNDWMAQQPGFIDHKLVQSNDGSTYVETVRWKSLEEAESAAQIAMTSSACGPMFEPIDFDTIQMLHGRVVDEAVAGPAA